MNLSAVSIVLALFAVVLGVIATRRLWRLRFWSAGASFVGAAALAGAAAVLFVIASNLHTYSRLTYEAPVADVIFRSLGSQRFEAALLRAPSGEMQVFILNGDEWQMDARVLKWRGWVNLFGLDAQFRLERLSGRYLDIQQERGAPRTVYSLSQNPGIDIWAWAMKQQGKSPLVDATYGSATYLPMADGARYRVTMSQTGLVARPMNSTATGAVERWPTAVHK